jgi:hypothetical protein
MTWLGLNLLLAIIFGILHQGGVVPALLQAGEDLKPCFAANSTAMPTHQRHIWWKTYPPPTWLMGETGVAAEVVNMREAPLGKVVRAMFRPAPRYDYCMKWVSFSE